MAARPSVLMVGATGMLGRPVARRLTSEGFTVRVVVRDLARAQRILPDACEFVRGDLRYQTSLQRALDGMDAVYVNLASPYSPRKWDPELEGTRRIVLAAQRMNVKRIVRISAEGVPEAVDEWWAAKRKAEADRIVMESDLEWTVFRPNWFCESLALFMVGPTCMRPSTPEAPLHWIAGDDYGRMVARALTIRKAVGKTYIVQGPEPVRFPDALRRFTDAIDRRAVTLPVPGAALRAMGVFSPPARYLAKLLDMSFRYTTEFVGRDTWNDLGEPTMRIEDYAVYLKETGDFPQK